MKINTNTLRFRLYTWYLGSLFVLSIYFYVIVHLLMLPHSDHIFLLLLFIMAFFGFLVIYRITSSLKSLSQQISTITSKHLDKRVQYLDGGEEIKVLTHSFNHVLNNLDAAFKREQQFIGDMAHELKTPFATLRSSFEVALSKTRTAEEYRKVLEEGIKDMDHLSSTMKDVLDLAWAETHHEQKRAERFNLSELLEEIGDIACKMASPKSLEVIQQIEKDHYYIGCKDKLARAFINIIENAINYTEKGTIILSLIKDQNQYHITVQDTGLGIKKKDLPHIFERFYRSSTTANIAGSGLGLAIAKSMIQLHNGTIEVSSEQEKGTKVSIKLYQSNELL